MLQMDVSLLSVENAMPKNAYVMLVVPSSTPSSPSIILAQRLVTQ
jgi:hypothetical protein